jgi:5-hydroxyisourate hydrolase-like protein (transthyretin family)
VSVEPIVENLNSSKSGLLVKAGIINYALPQAASVSLRLFDTQGKIVSELVKSNQSAGNYEVKVPSRGISQGNYILEFKAGNNFITKRINVL